MADKRPPPSKPETGGSDKSLFALVIFWVLVLLGFFVGRGFGFDFWGYLMAVRNFFAPFFERNLWWLEIVSAILSVLFLWGTVYIIRKAGYLEIKKEQFLDLWGRGYVSRRRTLKAWQQIQKRLLAADSNNWKLAILESDHILNEILKMSGYLGPKLEEKLELITPAQLSNVEEIKQAHQIRHKIASDPSFPITNEEAREIIAVYKKSFVELNLIRE